MAAAVELDKRLASLSSPFTAKDVYRNHWRLLDREGTTAALSILEDFGRIRSQNERRTRAADDPLRGQPGTSRRWRMSYLARLKYLETPSRAGVESVDTS